jgi:DnaK suppressor protein
MAEELTAAQLAELTADLLAGRSSLQLTMQQSVGAEEVVELDQATQGRLSRMDAMQQQKMAEAQKRRNQLRMKQIAVALDDVAKDDYGWCKRCGEPIGYRRMKARPESVCCVACMTALGG